MRILQLAPLWETVPPPAYGGTEAIVSLLTEGLVRRGHDVTLWASGDSTTSAELRSVFPRSLRTADDLADRAAHDWLHTGTALASAHQFDIIHNHVGELAMAFSSLVATPMLTTMHCAITSDNAPIWNQYRGYFNTISHAQQGALPLSFCATCVGTVHNAIDVASFPYCDEKDGYLLFLSRMAEEKAPHLAVEVARRLGMRILLAGKVDWRDRPYFDGVMHDLIDGDQVAFLGEADATMKRELYRKASCLLLPLQWDEPFGLVLTEAMACGTPVIAFRRGAAPELIVDGVTGYLVNTVDEMIDAVRKIGSINPLACRMHVEHYFDADAMVDRYVEVYERILSTERAPALPVPIILNSKRRMALSVLPAPHTLGSDVG